MSNPTIKKRVCDRCGKEFFETYKEWLCKDCMNELGWEYTPKTNADHIRSMTDEELAWRMMQLNFCPPNIDEYKECGKDANCHQCWVDWLKQPYEEDT